MVLTNYYFHAALNAHSVVLPFFLSWSSYILRRPQNFAKYPPYIWTLLKVAFIQKVRFVFLNLQTFKKKYSKLLSWAWNWICSLLLLTGNLYFMFRIVIWNNFFGDLEIWKTYHTFWKKVTFKYIEQIYKYCLHGSEYLLFA